MAALARVPKSPVLSRAWEPRERTYLIAGTTGVTKVIALTEIDEICAITNRALARSGTTVSAGPSPATVALHDRSDLSHACSESCTSSRRATTAATSHDSLRASAVPDGALAPSAQASA